MKKSIKVKEVSAWNELLDHLAKYPELMKKLNRPTPQNIKKMEIKAQAAAKAFDDALNEDDRLCLKQPGNTEKERIVLKADFEALQEEHEAVMRVARQDGHNLGVMRNLCDTLIYGMESLLSVYDVVGPFSSKKKEKRLRAITVKRAKLALEIARGQRLNPHLVDKANV